MEPRSSQLLFLALKASSRSFLNADWLEILLRQLLPRLSINSPRQGVGACHQTLSGPSSFRPSSLNTNECSSTLTWES